MMWNAPLLLNMIIFQASAYGDECLQIRDKANLLKYTAEHSSPLGTEGKNRKFQIDAGISPTRALQLETAKKL